jgi:hypothetical protein
MRGKVAVGLSALLLILLPVIGLVGGGWLAYERSKPAGLDCGLFVFPLLMMTGVGALAGLAAGVGIGWMLALGLFRWANRCGLGEIRNDPSGD